MPKDARLSEIDDIFKRMAEYLKKKVQSELKRKKWKSVFIDFRSSSEDGSGPDKLRLELPDGTIVKSIAVPVDITGLYLDAWELRENTPKKWYGLKLTVVPDGKSEILYHYDPRCADDPSFYDW